MNNPVTLLTANQLSCCGRIYPKEILEAIANQINEKKDKFLGYIEDSSKNGWDRIAFTVDSAHIEGDELKAEIKFLRTPMGEHIKEISNLVELDFRVNGIGRLKGRNIVSDYELKYLSVYPKEEFPEDAFNSYATRS